MDENTLYRAILRRDVLGSEFFLLTRASSGVGEVFHFAGARLKSTLSFEFGIQLRGSATKSEKANSQSHASIEKL